MVEVIWLDSYINAEHEIELDKSDAGFGGMLECRDIGYLVRKNKKELVLSVSRCYQDNTTRISNTIPIKWIREVIYLAPKLEEITPEAPK